MTPRPAIPPDRTPGPTEPLDGYADPARQNSGEQANDRNPDMLFTVKNGLWGAAGLSIVAVMAWFFKSNQKAPGVSSASESTRPVVEVSDREQPPIEPASPPGFVAPLKSGSAAQASESSKTTGSAQVPTPIHEASASTGVVAAEGIEGVGTTQASLLKAFKIPYTFQLYHQGTRTAQQLDSHAAAQALQTARQVTLGDLHGSYFKLVETLVAANLITMPLPVAEAFCQLAREDEAALYPLNTLSAQEKAAFKARQQQLSQLVPQIQWIGGDRKMILIGDVLSDRGPSDKITLELMEHLSRNHPDRFIRLASNHDHHALSLLAGQGLHLLGGQADSMNRAILAVEDDTKAAKKLRQQYQNYLGQSRLMHYEPDTQTLFVHAPITKFSLAALLAVMRNKGFRKVHSLKEIRSPDIMARFVNDANAFYSTYVELASRRRFLDDEAESVLVHDRGAGDGFLWIRDPLNNPAKMPLYGQGVIKCMVHGHDYTSEDSPFHWGDQQVDASYVVVNLDQQVRKGCVIQGDSKLFVQP